MIQDRSKLTTEKPNPRSKGIDSRSTLEIVNIINAEDRKVAPAVGKQGRQIARAVDMIVKAFGKGGRLFYVGAGTSGRLGVLDASECPPTFGCEPTMVQGVIAGGYGALVRSVEGAEDRAADGAAAMREHKLTADDVVVGIAACGLTPFVGGALEYAAGVGARTAFVTCAPESRGQIKADVVINPVVGPEVVTGSTRMKAGTATKLVLNTLTTAAMIRLGKVYDNLMVDMRATNSKLCDRSERIVMNITHLPREQARELLAAAGGVVKVAVVMAGRKLTAPAAEELLARSGGFLRAALAGQRGRVNHGDRGGRKEK
jgi:N-acetylmuramic acid 6-phosphate etherase